MEMLTFGIYLISKLQSVIYAIINYVEVCRIDRFSFMANFCTLLANR